MAGSEALKDTGYAMQSYAPLKAELIEKGILATKDNFYEFTKSFPFKSPSAVAAVVLDRNSNGRQEWKVVGSKSTYHEWQEQIAQMTAPG